MPSILFIVQAIPGTESSLICSIQLNTAVSISTPEQKFPIQYLFDRFVRGGEESGEFDEDAGLSERVLVAGEGGRAGHRAKGPLHLLLGPET